MWFWEVAAGLIGVEIGWHLQKRLRSRLWVALAVEAFALAASLALAAPDPLHVALSLCLLGIGGMQSVIWIDLWQRRRSADRADA